MRKEDIADTIFPTDNGFFPLMDEDGSNVERSITFTIPQFL
jgi:hypothetical protein